MTDIVERLRQKFWDGDEYELPVVADRLQAQCEEAADEIERLRASLRQIGHHVVTVSSPISVHELRKTAREALRHD